MAELPLPGYHAHKSLKSATIVAEILKLQSRILRRSRARVEDIRDEGTGHLSVSKISKIN